MARYKCFRCSSEHGTDNMEAVCAACWDQGIGAWKEKADRLGVSLSQAKADLAKAQTMRDEKAIAFDLAKAERDILLEVVKAIAYDDADQGFAVPENRCQAHHSEMARDAMRRAYQANKDL